MIDLRETQRFALDAREMDRAFEEDETPTRPAPFDFIDAHLDPSQLDAAPSSARLRSAVDWILPLEGVPFLGVARADVGWLGLTHAATQLLLRLDGVSPVTSLLASAGIPARDVVYELRELVQQGIVRFRAA